MAESVDDAPPNLAIRRMPLPIVAPCLTRHLVFRPKIAIDPTVAEDETEESARRKHIVDVVNQFMTVNRAQNFDVRKFSDSRPEGDEAFRNESVIVRLRGTNNDVLIRASLNMHMEIFTISLTVEMEGKKFSRLVEGKELKGRSEIGQMIFEFTSKMTNLRDSQKFGKDITKDAADKFLNSIYINVWKEIDKQLDVDFVYDEFDKIADFRGAVFNSSSREDISDNLKLRNAQGDRVIGDLPLSWQENESSGGLGTSLSDALSRNLHFVNERGDLFARILSCGMDQEWAKPPPAGNTAFCGFLDGLAVYGSSLRSPRSSTQPNESWHFLVYGGRSRHELGRLVGRLQRAGTIRVIALLDHDVVRQLSRKIRHIGFTLDKLGGPPGGGGDLGELSPESLTMLKAVQSDLSGVVRQARGGFKFRMSRVRDYGQQLEGALRALRCAKILGWQTYSDFIHRHILSEIFSLQTVRLRMEQLEQRLRSIQLNQINSALVDNSRKSTELIERMNESLAWSNLLSEEMQKTSEISNKTFESMVVINSVMNRNIRNLSILQIENVKIQAYAEYFIILGGCYYVSELVLGLWNTLVHNVPIEGLKLLDHNGAQAVMAVVAAAWIAIRRIANKRRLIPLQAGAATCNEPD